MCWSMATTPTTPRSAAIMVDPLLANSLDMVNGWRVPIDAWRFRPGHVFGNKLLTGPTRHCSAIASRTC